jgi:amino acid transporter
VAVPLVAALVIAGIRFAPDNFHAGGGFMPFGFHGVFAALTGGVVFSLQGFEQAGHLAGEARDPRKDLARAIIASMIVGALLYTLLQVVLIGALAPADVSGGWSKPLGTDPHAYGAWYTLALAVGAGWLANVLLVDAIVSPAGTGIVYVGTSARLSYALGEEREMPRALAKTNKQGVPVVSIVVAGVVGTLALGPFKSWNALVNVVTSATAIMYAFAPLSLAALHRLDPDRTRPYRVPRPELVLPASFCSANLIIYWGGFDTTWKLAVAMMIGLALFVVGAWRNATGDQAIVRATVVVRAHKTIRNALWMAPWLGGHVALGALGRYGGGEEILPAWIDIAVVIAFALVVYSVALRATLSAESCAARSATE